MSSSCSHSWKRKGRWVRHQQQSSVRSFAAHSQCAMALTFIHCSVWNIPYCMFKEKIGNFFTYNNNVLTPFTLIRMVYVVGLGANLVRSYIVCGESEESARDVRQIGNFFTYNNVLTPYTFYTNPHGVCGGLRGIF